MAYEPKTWSCDDTITADDLNHIEQGIANASGGGTASEPLIVRIGPVEDDTKRLDKTFGEIKEAFNSGRPIYCASDYPDGVTTEYRPLFSIVIGRESGGEVLVGEDAEYSAETDEDYPIRSGGR